VKPLNEQKTPTRQFSILLPILTGNENKEKVVEKLKNYEKIILSFVIDSESNSLNPTSAGTKIKEAEDIIEELREKLAGKEVIEQIIWGDTLQKTTNIAKLHKINDIMLVDTQRMKKDLEDKFNVIVVKTV